MNIKRAIKMRDHAIKQNKMNRLLIDSLQKSLNNQIDRFKDPWISDEVLDAEQECLDAISELQQLLVEITRNDVIIATIEGIR
tara:strand:- start:324 stop:572 length:249 start_codon:yes stop_codon:yes gene_type:complete